MKKSLLIFILVTIVQGNEILLSAASLRYGAETIALGETGVAFSNSLETHWYNPANSALYGSERKIKTAISGGFEPLMPSKEEDIYLSHGMAGYFTPLFDSLFNLAAVFSYSAHSWEQEMYDYTWSEEAGVFEPFTVEAERASKSFVWGVSLALKEYLSFGIDLKYFTGYTPITYVRNGFDEYSGYTTKEFQKVGFSSTSYTTVEYETGYFSCNLGFRGQYRFDISDNFFIKPSAGISFLGLSKDSVTMDVVSVRGAGSLLPDSEYHDSYNELLYTQLFFGTALTLGNEDVFWGSVLYDNSRELGKEYPYNFITHSFGYQLNATPIVSFNAGFLYDFLEGDRLGREEFHCGATIGYRSLAMNRFFMKKGIARYTETKLKNLELLYSFSVITNFPGIDSGIRKGQHSHQLTFAMDFGRTNRSEVKVSDSESELGLE